MDQSILRRQNSYKSECANLNDWEFYKCLFPTLPDLVNDEGEANYLKLDKNGQVKDFSIKEQQRINKKLEKIENDGNTNEIYNIIKQYIQDIFDNTSRSRNSRRNKKLDLKDFLKPQEIKQCMIEKYDDPNKYQLIDQFLKSNLLGKIAKQLKDNFGLIEADYNFADGLVINKGNWSKYYSVVCKVTFLLRDFKFKNAFTFIWGDNEVNIEFKTGYTLEQRRQILRDLAIYLHTIIHQDDDLKKIYIEKQKLFIGFNEKEEFDHPLLLILCALFSTIGEKSDFETRSSDLNWMDEDHDEFFNISFGINTGRTADTYATTFEIENARKLVKDLLIHAGVFPDILLAYNNQGNSIIGTWSDLSDVYIWDLNYADKEHQLRTYYKYLIMVGDLSTFKQILDNRNNNF